MSERIRDLTVEHLGISTLKPYARNAHTHTPAGHSIQGDPLSEDEDRTQMRTRAPALRSRNSARRLRGKFNAVKRCLGHRAGACSAASVIYPSESSETGMSAFSSAPNRRAGQH